MKAWLQRKLGITPELIKHAHEMERRVTARAELLPHQVNRSVLLLLPLEKYFEWRSQWEAMFKGGSRRLHPIEDRWLHARAYLIEEVDSLRELSQVVQQHRRYFMESFLDGHAPKTQWPWVPSEDEFPEWFEVQLVGWGPWDLGQTPLAKEPDLLMAIGSEPRVQL